MCIAQNTTTDPRLRHRAAYLAPTRFRPEEEGNLRLEGLLPLFDNDDEDDDDISHARRNARMDSSRQSFLHPYGKKCLEAIVWVFQSLLDLVILLLVACLSLFFHDLEIHIVKTSDPEDHPSNVLQGSRIVWRTESSILPITRTTRQRSFEETIV
jgi:hypothetical protein